MSIKRTPITIELYSKCIKQESDISEEIAKILPTTDGFFFGSTEYDEYYMKDIDYTIELIQGLLKEEEEIEKLGFYSSDFVYSSSW